MPRLTKVIEKKLGRERAMGEAITTSATFVARILWRQGYRKCDL